ncbi:MAG: TenA family transcriptional regulator [Nitrospirota bacterium]
MGIVSSVKPTVEATNFIKSLEAEILAHEAVRHPFLARFASEPLTIEQVKAFGLQHYQLVRVFTTYMTNLLPKIPDHDAAELFRHVFDDEFGAVSGRDASVGQATIFRSHVHLYRDFLAAMGVRDEEWGRTRPLPETDAYIRGHLALTRDEDFRVGLGAVGPGHEFSIPTMFKSLIAGIRRNTSLTDQQIEYFTLHVEEDVEHAEVFNQLIARHADTEDGRTMIRSGAMKSLAWRSLFWDGLNRAVFAPHGARR